MAQKMQSGVSVKKLFIDYKYLNSSEAIDFKRWHSGYELGYNAKFSDKVTLYVPIRIASLKHYDEGLNNVTMFGVDGQLRYDLTANKRKVNPYLGAGLGFVMESFDSSHIQVPFVLGANIKLSELTSFNGEISYRLGFDDNKSALQTTIGFTHFFGKLKEEIVIPEVEDRDMDGIPDDMDQCPDTPGLEELFGCPDTDGDGIPDAKDKCPDEPGKLSDKGCPDTDGDGVIDMDDECPEVPGTILGCPDKDGDGVIDSKDKCVDVPGLVSNDGCPEEKIVVVKSDRDKDGISDSEDKCPDIYGIAAFMGCPDTDGDGLQDSEDRCPTNAGPMALRGCPDSDGDGVSDYDDKCPNVIGTISNSGCPELTLEEKEVLAFAVQAVEFDTGKSTLRSSSFAILNKIADILKKYPSYRLRISGHTDSSGDAGRNQELSERRARSCYEYLSSRGISVSRMSYAGFGETDPIADNTTSDGKARNRRVEFDVDLN